MKNILIAIDQGGSKTELIAFSDTGDLLFRTNDRGIREEKKGSFEDNRWFFITKLVNDSLHALGASISDVSGIMAALCGADWPEDYDTMHCSIVNHLGIAPERVFIVNDCVAALRAGQPIMGEKQDCAVIYAGTRFNCSLLSKSRESYTYGRFVNVNDHGAYAIGQQVWRAVVDSYNGFQEPTLMEALLLRHYHMDYFAEICQCFSMNKLSVVPVDLVSLFFEAIKKDDKIAKSIMSKFSSRWVKYVICGTHKVNITKDCILHLYLSGGLFKNCPNLWLEEIQRSVSLYDFPVRCTLGRLEPVGGAVMLLLEKFRKGTIDKKTADNLINSPIYKGLLVK